MDKPAFSPIPAELMPPPPPTAERLLFLREAEERFVHDRFVSFKKQASQMRVMLRPQSLCYDEQDLYELRVHHSPGKRMIPVGVMHPLYRELATLEMKNSRNINAFQDGKYQGLGLQDLPYRERRKFERSGDMSRILISPSAGDVRGLIKKGGFINEEPKARASFLGGLGDLLHHTEQHREATPQESLESSLRTPTPNLRVAPPKVKVNLTESRVLNGTEGSDRIRELALTRKHLSRMERTASEPSPKTRRKRHPMPGSVDPLRQTM